MWLTAVELTVWLTAVEATVWLTAAEATAWLTAVEETAWLTAAGDGGAALRGRGASLQIEEGHSCDVLLEDLLRLLHGLRASPRRSARVPRRSRRERELQAPFPRACDAGSCLGGVKVADSVGGGRIGASAKAYNLSVYGFIRKTN